MEHNMLSDNAGNFSFLDENSSKDRPKALMDECTYSFDIVKTVAFSGHRPESLPDDERRIKVIKSLIVYEIESAISDGFETFITGGARGIDLWAALGVIERKKKHPNLKLIAALPYNAEAKYSESERFEYGYILNQCDEVFYASIKFTKDSMLRRNKFMVDNSSRLIAFIKDYRSGTGQTINLAKASGIVTHVHKIDELF
jgi:uncharacterized phage-like protein YoqJ